MSRHTFGQSLPLSEQKTPKAKLLWMLFHGRGVPRPCPECATEVQPVYFKLYGATVVDDEVEGTEVGGYYRCLSCGKMSHPAKATGVYTARQNAARAWNCQRYFKNE